MRSRLTQWTGCIFWAVSATLVALAGCTKGDVDKKADTKGNVQIETRRDNQGKPIPVHPVGLTKGMTLLPFKDAVILDDPPEKEMRPPEFTHTGRHAVKIFETIANGLWDQVAFTDDARKPIRYQAIIATELGDIHLDLYGDAAPNHVRSFVCLAKSGYYDGMTFYRSVQRKVEDNDIAFIETGCPRGGGDNGSGSIGYWLRQEITTKLTHEEGVLGACRGEDPNSASCRFYLMAAAAPIMDGEFTIFGKVTRGLDVVRTINKREVRDFDMLAKPVLIKSVTIQTIDGVSP
jgi:peptidyl-prolyl cis-trans isomerase B (cyclophilin B)